jgi:hypothetical protein
MMGFIVTATFIGRVALHHRAAHMIYDLFPEVRAEEILVSRFAGMDFDGHITRELLAQTLKKSQYGFRGDFGSKINFGFHNIPTFLSLL